jgi:hypothetical protein
VASVALTLGALLALLIALLAVPLTVVFSIHRIKQTEGFVRFLWLFGLVRFQLRIPRAAKARPRPESTPRKKAKPPARTKKKGTARGIVSLLQQSAFRRRVYKFIRDILTATHARDLFVRLRIGLGDPADTGRLWAIIGPIAGMAQNLRSATVRIEAEFVDPVFEVESHGQFRLVPIQFIALAAAFVLSPTMLRAWRRLRRGNG